MSRLGKPRRLAPPSRSRFSLVFLVGNLIFVLLLGGGVGYSLYARGRLPDVRFGYVDNHRQLLESGKQGELMPDLRTAALVNFDDASAQLQLLSTASLLNDSKNIAVAMRGLLSHTPDDAELHAELAAVLLSTAALAEALLHSSYAVKLIPLLRPVALDSWGGHAGDRTKSRGGQRLPGGSAAGPWFGISKASLGLPVAGLLIADGEVLFSTSWCRLRRAFTHGCRCPPKEIWRPDRALLRPPGFRLPLDRRRSQSGRDSGTLLAV